MPPPANRHELIAQIRALPAQVAAISAELSAEQLTTHYLAHEWSVAQNIHHLADSHMNAYIRCKLILTEEHPPLKPYRQEAWAELGEASQADISTSLALLSALHTRWAAFWEQLPDSAWARSGHHPQYGEMSLAGILASYAEHGLGHIDQMQRTLAAATNE